MSCTDLTLSTELLCEVFGSPKNLRKVNMKALILAAGDGGRFGNLTRDKPKSLIKLLGLSLIERVIFTAKQAGINEFVITVGYLGDKIKANLGDGEKFGVKIDYIENEEWQEGNGISVLKAKGLLKENFILLMSDHIFDYRILKELVDYGLRSSIVLAVDRREPLLEEVKVLEKKGKIVDIGIEIEESNCIDTGIFLCSPKIFSHIEETVEEGKTELADCIAKAAKDRDADVFDITQIDSYVSGMKKAIKLWWVDIDTKKDLRKAEQILCKNLIKPTDGLISRLFNRPISLRISKLLLKFRINPNSISFISFIIGVLSAFFFCIGNYLSIVIGGLLAQFSSIFDGCDGEIARLKFQQSNYGGWFDAVLDRYADALIIFGMTYGYWSLHNDILIWVIGFIALVGSFMSSYTADKYDAIYIKKGKTRGFRVRIGRDTRLFLLMIGALAGQIFYTLMVIGILTNFESIRRFVLLRNE